MKPVIEKLAKIALGPLLYLQARAVRRSVPRLPEPPGNRAGSTGSGPRLRLLVLGDSAAAGVGAAHQDEALLGNLVARLSTQYTVAWRLFARTGATSASTLQRLEMLEAGPFDIAIVSLGVNDVTSGIGLETWLAQQARLRRVLRDRFGITRIVACGLPPVHGFPALPQPLRWYLGQRASAFDRALERALADAPDAVFLSLRFTEDLSLMAEDGFHPGPVVYREWGRRAARMIVAAVEPHAQVRDFG